MSSQRFCLRWNNHQSNLLSVFDQHLHDEAFVDVTLAVDGQFLRAHKMVLSACSPYFQALFVGHPDRHPIVILKDVPYSDMRSLLDFMYRGEVSVDQDRLTAFLKIAESLRIKGLTEVNEERCDLPSIANSLLNQSTGSSGSSLPSSLPPPNLHRIPMPAPKRPNTQNVYYSHPNAMLNSALSGPKRKRGRPRKLSGGSPGTPNQGMNDLSDHEDSSGKQNHVDNGTALRPDHMVIKSEGSSCASPSDVTCKEERITNENQSGSCPTTAQGSDHRASSQSPEMKIEKEDDMQDEDDSPDAEQENEDYVKTDEPKPGTSGQDGMSSFQKSMEAGERLSSSGLERMMRLIPLHDFKAAEDESDSESLIVDSMGDAENNNDMAENEEKPSPNSFSDFIEPARPSATKRRVRRRTTSSTDPAEALTEMSVRGLNLFRYASITEGVYKCMECAKTDMVKTFKNKYSFQRHAFLYHEGHQRKVFPCPVCAKEFSRPDKMKNHMKMVHDCFMPKETMFPTPGGYYLPP